MDVWKRLFEDPEVPQDESGKRRKTDVAFICQLADCTDFKYLLKGVRVNKPYVMSLSLDGLGVEKTEDGDRLMFGTSSK